MSVVRERPVTVALPGGPLTYTLRHSPRARSIRVTIHPERGVVVTMPATRAAHRDGEARAASFLREREPWLRRHLARQSDVVARVRARGGARDGGNIPFRGRLHRVRVVPAVSGVRRSEIAAFDDELVIHRVAGERRDDPAIVEGWLRAQAAGAIDAAIDAHAPALGVVPSRVTLRDQRTRWGSASRAGRLSFSWRLVLAPPEALETVVVHELAHLRIFGHAPAFWSLVASRRPDHRTWRRWLHDHAHELHGALG